MIADAEVELIKQLENKNTPNLKSTADSVSLPIKFEVSKVSIKNTKFHFVNERKKQNIAIHFIDNTIKLKRIQEGIEAELDGDIKIGELLFKKEKGPFLKDTKVTLNFKTTIYTKYKSVFIHQPSHVFIGSQRYSVNAYLDLNDQKLILNIQGNGVRYDESVRLLNTNIQNILSNFKVSKPFDAAALIVVKLGVKEDPILLVKISGKDNAVMVGNSKIPYSQISFNSTIISLDSSFQKGNTEKAKIIFRPLKGNVYDFPFTASIQITNLEDPTIKIKAQLFIEASKIKFKPGKDFILKGNCIANINYSGPTNKLNKNQFLDTPMKLNTILCFKDFSYKEFCSPYTYMIRGKAFLNNKDIKFENLLLKMDGGEVMLKGKAEGFTKYALGFNKGFKAYLTAQTDYFNLNPYLSRRDGKDTLQTAIAAGKKKNKAIPENNFEFQVLLLAKKLIVRKVEAENADMELFYKNKLIAIKSLKMNLCDGKLAAKGSIYDLNKIDIEVAIQKINVRRLFTQFENFGQTAVESRNLEGLISLNARFKTDLDDKMEIIGESMFGEVKLKLENGHLLDYEPLQNISNYIFKKRNFKDISFTEINETFKIKGYEMQIQDMEIASNVLNVYVSGIYHFKEHSNINLLIPWNNLKSRGKNYLPKISKQDADNSKGLKLNYAGLSKNLKLSLGHK